VHDPAVYPEPFATTQAALPHNPYAYPYPAYPWSMSQPQGAATARPLGRTTHTHVTEMPAYYVTYAPVLPHRAPANASARKARLRKLNPANLGYHLPGYGGFVQSNSFRFGKSFGRITADVLRDFPGGRYPAKKQVGYTAQPIPQFK